MKPLFVGGSLSFKGDKKKKAKKRKNSVKSSLKTKSGDVTVAGEQQTTTSGLVIEQDLTEAERKALLRKRKRDEDELKVVASKSHRERVEEFNEKLGKQTEHNDIPRVRKCRVCRCNRLVRGVRCVRFAVRFVARLTLSVSCFFILPSILYR